MNECQSLILSEDAKDYIIRYNSDAYRQLAGVKEACVQCIDETWCIAHTSGNTDIDRLISDSGYYSIPKLYGLMQSDSSNYDESGITSTLNQSNLNVRGQGVIIGFIDTGIDYTLDIFMYARNRSKILAIWDQTIQEEQAGNETISGENTGQVDSDYSYLTSMGIFNYGKVYETDVINNALEKMSAGESPYKYVPSVDDNGHGTFMAGIAAGSQTKAFMGAAPDAQLVVVKLKQAKQYLRDYYLIRNDIDAYEESDIMAGIRFLRYIALKENKPLVICLGVGTASGSRMGLTPLASMLNSMALRNNVVVVTPVGNEGNARTHISGRAADEDNSWMDISVGDNVEGFSLEIWADTFDILSVSFVSPSGQVIPRILVRVGQSSEFRFLLENTTVSIDYRIAETVSGYEVIFIRFLTPSEGVWQIRAYSIAGISGEFNAWLQLKDFIKGEVFFLRSEPDTTLTEPSAAFSPISVGAYNHITGGIAVDSGRGYTSDDRVKPDIVAPGVNVYGPAVGGGFILKSGTSISAAHTAGAAALFLTWGVYYGNDILMTNSKIKTILIRGATRDTDRRYPDNVWGYGKLNVIESFLQLRLV